MCIGSSAPAKGLLQFLWLSTSHPLQTPLQRKLSIPLLPRHIAQGFHYHYNVTSPPDFVWISPFSNVTAYTCMCKIKTLLKCVVVRNTDTVEMIDNLLKP